MPLRLFISISLLSQSECWNASSRIKKRVSFLTELSI
jgi:hypothetical protein